MGKTIEKPTEQQESMSIDDKSVLLSQLTSSIGLQISPTNARIILDMMHLIDLKGENTSLADLNNMLRKYQ